MTTRDRFLDGRLTIRQPADGFRAGLDAVMVAAMVPAQAGEAVLELGAGVGTASFCLAARVDGVCALGVEIDANLTDLAGTNAADNTLAARVSFVTSDVLALATDLNRQFDHVFTNPPFYTPGGQSSPVASKTRAKMDDGHLADWLSVGLKRTRSGGTFTAILSTDRLSLALGALPDTGVTVFPLWPKAGAPAKRVIVQARQGAKSPFVLAAGLVLHAADGAYTPAADAILRGGALILGDKP